MGVQKFYVFPHPPNFHQFAQTMMSKLYCFHYTGLTPLPYYITSQVISGGKLRKNVNTRVIYARCETATKRRTAKWHNWQHWCVRIS